MGEEMDGLEALLNGEVKLELEIAGEVREEEEWVVVPWRALSEGLLSDRPLKFSAAVLKAGLDEFNNAPVFPDHYDSVRNWLGRTDNAKYSAKTPQRPGGVDFEVWLDKTVTPEENADSFRIIKGVQRRVLRCGSVDVRFEYKPSHPNLENWRYRLGEVVDNEVVCLEVTRIIRIAEFSIVYAGSDKYATRLALDQHDSKEDKVSDQKMAVISALLGLEKEASETEVKSAIEKLKADASFKLTIGKGENQKEISDRESILKLATDGHSYRQKLVEKAQASYKLVRGDQVNQSYLESIPGMDTQAVLAIAEEYESQAEKLIPLKCAKCGSVVTRRSSEPGQTNDAEGTGGFDLENIF